MSCNNGHQFDRAKVTDYLSTLGCQARFTVVAHPQTNGQVEAANKVILYTLQKKLDEAKGQQAEELHGTLWSIHTIGKTAIGETPIMLAYRSEVIQPIEHALHTHRLSTFQEELNNVALRKALDLLPPIRGDALLREALCKVRIVRLHDCTIKLHPIRAGYFILRRTEAMACAREHDKLTTN